MYISTAHYIGNTVYFINEAGSSVTRAEVAEIRTTQYANSTNTVYLVVFDEDDCRRNEACKQESDLYTSPDSAFRAWDRAHPLHEPEPEALAA